MSPKYALYCRAAKSSVSDPKHSIEGQKRRLLTFARHLGLSVNHVFVDVGSTRQQRPQFQAMLKHLKRRRITGILTADLSRLTRDYAEMQKLSEMMDHGIIREISTLRETFTSSFMLSISALLLRQERQVLSDCIRRGIALARHQKTTR